jgi:hypothetical protein
MQVQPSLANWTRRLSKKEDIEGSLQGRVDERERARDIEPNLVSLKHAKVKAES